MLHLPLPTLDHVVINVRDQLDEAAALYRRLGFCLTPRGYHTLGSTNHLAIFANDYLELIAVPPGKTDRNDILGYPAGLNALVFGCEDSDALYDALAGVGAPIQTPNNFSRPVEFEGGSGDAAFRTTRLLPSAFPAGRLYFCEHKTRNLVWRDEWRRHTNGVVGVACTTTVTPEPERFAGLMRQMFGAEMVRVIKGGFRLLLGLSSFDAVTPGEAERRYGDAAPDPAGRSDFMACLRFRVTDLDETAAVLARGGISFDRTGGTLRVSAGQTMGATLEFA
jgi:catechol 2,3-dioxygenase-like lactoylglutathione lyase family enzyme